MQEFLAKFQHLQTVDASHVHVLGNCLQKAIKACYPCMNLHHRAVQEMTDQPFLCQELSEHIDMKVGGLRVGICTSLTLGVCCSWGASWPIFARWPWLYWGRSRWRRDRTQIHRRRHPHRALQHASRAVCWIFWWWRELCCSGKQGRHRCLDADYRRWVSFQCHHQIQQA